MTVFGTLILILMFSYAAYDTLNTYFEEKAQEQFSNDETKEETN